MTLSELLQRAPAQRSVHGISAVLLPYTRQGSIDWTSFERLVQATAASGLDVAVNMDTGFGDLLSPAERRDVLDMARRHLGKATLYAGAYPDQGSADPLPSYRASVADIVAADAVPVIVQWRGSHRLDAVAKAELYRQICSGAERVLAFELGSMFAPHGEIWDEETYRRILEIPQLKGAKHSSLDREIELSRLALRDRHRPEFRVYTGNDLAIDMVLFGSDYLLGLSTFTPARFAERDRKLADDDIGFLSLNDAIQYLGNVGFRAPVPAYKHSAALFLHITGALDHDTIHPRAARRPASDRIVLFDCARRLGLLADPEAAWATTVAPFVTA